MAAVSLVVYPPARVAIQLLPTELLRRVAAEGLADRASEPRVLRWWGPVVVVNRAPPQLVPAAMTRAEQVSAPASESAVLAPAVSAWLEGAQALAQLVSAGIAPVVSS